MKKRDDYNPIKISRNTSNSSQDIEKTSSMTERTPGSEIILTSTAVPHNEDDSTCSLEDYIQVKLETTIANETNPADILATIKTEPQEIHDVDPMSYFDDDMTITELGPQSLIQRVKQEPREYTQLGCVATYNILAPMATTLTVAEPQSVIDHIKEEPREYTQLGCGGITYNTLTPMATTLTLAESHSLNEHIKQEPTQIEYNQEPEYTQLGNYNPHPTHHLSQSQHHSPHPLHHNTDHVLMTPTEQNRQQEDKPKPKIKSKKVKREDMEGSELTESPASKKKVKQEKITDSFKVRKKVDRFGGVPEDEIIKKTLPDHLALDLDIIIIGINPGLFAAYKGHHYAGPGNHFWKCLFLAGLIPEPMTAVDDFKLIKHGIGFTNIVGRTTRGSADLKRLEIKEGAKVLLEKIQKYKPKIAAFNGKGIYEVFCGHKKFDIGKQPDPIAGTNTVVYVMPSSSARCAQLPRAIDKVPFYIALKKLRDYLCGLTSHLDESEVIFPDLKIAIKSEEDIENETIKSEAVDSETKPEPAPKNPKKSKKKNQQPQQSADTNYSGVTVKQENHNDYMANSRSINMQPFNQSYQNASGNQYPDMYNYSPQHNYPYPNPQSQGMPDGSNSWVHNMPPFQNTIVPHQPLPGYNHHYDPGSFADQIPSIYKNQQSRQAQPPPVPSNFHQGLPPSQGAPVQPVKQTSQNQNSDLYGGVKIKQEHLDETYTTYEQGHYNINQT